MAGKIIRRAGGIHHQDCTVHPFSDDLAGELEPLLARSAEEVDIATFYLEPPEIEGMDVVDKIGKVQTDANDRPLRNVTITRAVMA